MPAVDPFGSAIPESYDVALEGAGWTEVHHGDVVGTTEFAATLGG